MLSSKDRIVSSVIEICFKIYFYIYSIVSFWGFKCPFKSFSLFILEIFEFCLLVLLYGKPLSWFLSLYMESIFIFCFALFGIVIIIKDGHKLFVIIKFEKNIVGYEILFEG